MILISPYAHFLRLCWSKMALPWGVHSQLVRRERRNASYPDAKPEEATWHPFTFIMNHDVLSPLCFKIHLCFLCFVASTIIRLNATSKEKTMFCWHCPLLEILTHWYLCPIFVSTYTYVFWHQSALLAHIEENVNNIEVAPTLKVRRSNFCY